MIYYKKDDVKLDFNDVLIEPRESDVPLTRKSVDIEIDWLGTKATPIIISNMLSTGTYNIANILTPLRIFTFIHKEYTASQHIAQLEKMQDRRFIAITSGVQSWDKQKTIEVVSKFPDIGFINIDIANIYANIDGMVETIKLYREKFPDIKISAGNVATAKPVQIFADAGANFI